MKPIALIVAGGTGTRMGTTIPKQFLLLNKKPVLMHTLQRFFENGCDLVLVLPEYQITYWTQLCKQYQFGLEHQVVVAGDTRFQSVKNGLELVPNDTLVAIHDGVRPCVDVATIQRTFEVASKKGNAIASVKLKDSIRKVDEKDNFSVDRTQFVLIQKMKPKSIKLLLLIQTT
jgi:2-C-methyl-D-erythritol 4-phosphate cytidylyltransferase